MPGVRTFGGELLGHERRQITQQRRQEDDGGELEEKQALEAAAHESEGGVREGRVTDAAEQLERLASETIRQQPVRRKQPQKRDRRRAPCGRRQVRYPSRVRRSCLPRWSASARDTGTGCCHRRGDPLRRE